MNRKEKVEYLPRLAASRLTPGDILHLLPSKIEAWITGGKVNRESITAEGPSDLSIGRENKNVISIKK